MKRTKHYFRFGGDYPFVTISDSKGEVIHWDKAEWEEDPSLVMAICNAVKMAAEGKNLRKLIRLYPRSGGK
jgi:hypothetical protein